MRGGNCEVFADRPQAGEADRIYLALWQLSLLSIGWILLEPRIHASRPRKKKKKQMKAETQCCEISSREILAPFIIYRTRNRALQLCELSTTSHSSLLSQDLWQLQMILTSMMNVLLGVDGVLGRLSSSHLSMMRTWARSREAYWIQELLFAVPFQLVTMTLAVSFSKMILFRMGSCIDCARRLSRYNVLPLRCKSIWLLPHVFSPYTALLT